MAKKKIVKKSTPRKRAAPGKKVAKKSRSETRAKLAQVKEAERSTDATAARGVSTKEKFALATLEHSQERDTARNIRELLVIANVDESNALKQLELMDGMLQRAINREDSNEEQVCSDQKLSLFEELAEIRDRKKRLREQSDELLSVKRSKVGTAVSVPTKPSEDASTLTKDSLGNNKKKSGHVATSESGHVATIKAKPNATVVTYDVDNEGDSGGSPPDEDPWQDTSMKNFQAAKALLQESVTLQTFPDSDEEEEEEEETGTAV